jgi:hypothetical protein
MKFFLIFLLILFSNFSAYAEKNNNTDSNKFKTECKLLEAEISLLLFYADNKFMNKPELISKYLKEVNFHEIVNSWDKLCK